MKLDIGTGSYLSFASSKLSFRQAEKMALLPKHSPSSSITSSSFQHFPFRLKSLNMSVCTDALELMGLIPRMVNERIWFNSQQSHLFFERLSCVTIISESVRFLDLVIVNLIIIWYNCMETTNHLQNQRVVLRLLR